MQKIIDIILTNFIGTNSGSNGDENWPISVCGEKRGNSKSQDWSCNDIMGIMQYHMLPSISQTSHFVKCLKSSVVWTFSQMT